ncbi:MAG: hypothetical protein A3K19_31895 [Lentisphaerae bacterium RIFOXYB12_FULL_65_16]|nr:MAG: hypothetical protein A3K18_10675 [Lentisphaerae bacterium RIFOXYA12_64_32]OGV88704.1 MAG: hypothetical protein A3K19_31895 [Lentisphaerae bacterium RIFOXYB12_FULL_65_16]
MVVCSVAATLAAFCFDWHHIIKVAAICGILSGLIGMLKYAGELRERLKTIRKTEAEMAGAEQTGGTDPRTSGGTP